MLLDSSLRRSLWFVPLVALITVLLSASTASGARTIPSVPQLQFFHASISGTTLSDNGTTVKDTISFTTNQPGALQFTSEDSTIIPPLPESTCLTNDVDTITTILLLDGTQIASISHKGLLVPGESGGITGGQIYTCALADIGLTTASAVKAGKHTVTLEYTTSTNPNPPSQTGNMVNGGGTMSLTVITPGTSN